MKDAGDYLAHIKALIALNRQVVHWTIVREEAQGDMGLLRYRLTLQDSFHWQNTNGELRKRWDNAAHHPETSTHPNHVHEGSDAGVLPHGPISAEEILAFVTPEMTN